MRTAACQSFAGGLDLGFKQAGADLQTKVELKGGFGSLNVIENYSLVGSGWKYAQGAWDELIVPEDGADVVYGCPPCSGFSLASTPGFRGVNSPVNSCMHVLVAYAARVPEARVLVMESVQQAFWLGRPLMLTLREAMEERTGKRWLLTHVLHGAWESGNAARRNRYFMVLSLAEDGPFEVRTHVRSPEEPATLRDAIGDLEDVPIGWGIAQTLEAGAEGHVAHLTPFSIKMSEMLSDPDVAWVEGEYLCQVMTRYYDKFGTFHGVMKDKEAKFLARDRLPNGDLTGFGFASSQPCRWRMDAPARVITGSSTITALHPTRPSALTHRECARIMGYPDEWVINASLMAGAPVWLWWGKQVTVDCGRWIGQNVSRHLDRLDASRRPTVDQLAVDGLALAYRVSGDREGAGESIVELSRPAGLDLKKFAKKFPEDRLQVG